MDRMINVLARSSTVLVAAASLSLVVGCLADPGEEWVEEAAVDAGASEDGVVLAEMEPADFGPLPEAARRSVGFRATFHSMDEADPDFLERREGGRVDAIQPAGGKVFIGGYFNRAIRIDGTQVTRNGLAAMNTSTLNLVGACNPRLAPAGLYGARVRALALSRDGTILFVGGRFSSVGGVARRNLAAIRVSDCALLPHFAGWTVNGEVYSLLVDGGSLYVGGDFTSIGGVQRARVAKLGVGTGSATVRAWNPGSSGRVKAMALDRANGRVILVLESAGVVAGQAGSETVALTRASGAFVWNANTGDGGMAAVVMGTIVYVGVRGVGGRVYAYRLSDGQQLFWHWNNGDVQALTRYGRYVTVGFHDNVVSEQNNSTDWDISAHGLWRMTASGSVDMGWRPDILARPADSPWKVWSLHGDIRNGRLYAGGDFTIVEGRQQQRFAVFQAPP